MNRSIPKDEILDYLYRSKHCFEESSEECVKKYFLHCIMAVYHLALKCDVLKPGDITFYESLFIKDKMCDTERAIAEICDFGGDY